MMENEVKKKIEEVIKEKEQQGQWRCSKGYTCGESGLETLLKASKDIPGYNILECLEGNPPGCELLNLPNFCVCPIRVSIFRNLGK